MVMWQRSANASQVFEGQGVDASSGMDAIEQLQAGFQAGVVQNPGGVSLIMAQINAENARKAAKVLNEEVVPLAGAGYEDWTGNEGPEAFRDPITAARRAAPYMQAAYDADHFRPESGDERRIIGDKYKIARDLAGKQAEQLARARELDPTILDMEEQKRAAISRAKYWVDRSNEADGGLAGTLAWFVGTAGASIDPQTNPAWGLNIIPLGGASIAARVGGQAIASTTQSLVEDLVPMNGLPTRTENMAWLGEENDAVFNALTAAAFGAVFQIGGEAIVKGLSIGAKRMHSALRAEDGETRVLNDIAGGDQASRVRVAQDLDGVKNQLDGGARTTELTPSGQPLSEHASTMPSSKNSLANGELGPPPRTDAEVIARAKQLDPEAHKEFDKAAKRMAKFQEKNNAALETVVSRAEQRLAQLDEAIARAEKEGASASVLEGLGHQRQSAAAAAETEIATMTGKTAPREAALQLELDKWGKLKADAQARARGEWSSDTPAGAAAVTEGVAGGPVWRKGGFRGWRVAPVQESTVARPTGRAPKSEATFAKGGWRVGDPIEHVPPPMDHPLARDTGEGTPVERAQRVVDAKTKEAIETNKAYVNDVKAKLDELKDALENKGKKDAVDPNDIKLLDGTPVRNLTGLNKVDMGDTNGQEVGNLINLRKELDDLGDEDQVRLVAVTCGAEVGYAGG